MERLDNLPDGNHTAYYPSEVTDYKKSNFGVGLHNHIKVRDYDTSNLIEPSGQMNRVVFNQNEQDYFRELFDDLSDIENS